MTNLELPPIVGLPKQPQDNQQLMQMAQLKMQMDRMREAEGDHRLNNMLTILQAPWVEPQEKVRVANDPFFKNKLGIQGDITLAGVAPYYEIVSGLVKKIKAGEDISGDQGLISYFMANPTFVAPSQRADILQAGQQIQTGQIEQLAELEVPRTVQRSAFETAKENLDRYEPLLQATTQADLTDRYEGMHTARGEPVPLIAATPNMQLDALRKDQALVAQHTIEEQQREQVRALFRAHPASIDKALEGKFLQLGMTGASAKDMITAKTFQLLQKDERTPQDEKFIQGWASTIASPEQAEAFGRFTTATDQRLMAADLQQTQGRRLIVDGTMTTDQQAQTAVNAIAQQRTQTMESMAKQKNVNDQTAIGYLAQANMWLQGIEQGKQAYAQAAAPQAQFYQQTATDLKEQLKSQEARLVNAPLGQHEMLNKRIASTKEAIKATEAGYRLMTGTNPFAGEELQGSLAKAKLDLVKAEAEGNREAMGTAKALISSLERSVTTAEQARTDDLNTLGSYRLSLLEREKATTRDLSALEYRMDKDQKMRLAVQMTMSLRDQGMGLTQAVREAGAAAKVDSTDLAKKVKEFGDLALPAAQRDLGIMAQAYQEKHGPGAVPPAELRNMTTRLMGRKEYADLKREDIMAGMEEKILRAEVNLPYDPKQSVQEAGKLANIQQSIREVQQMRELLVGPTGEINRGRLFASAFDIPFTTGRDINTFTKKAVEIKLRAATGAAARPDETRNYMNIFAPSVKDSDELIRYKIDAFEEWLQTVASTTDPTGDLRKRAETLMAPGIADVLKSSDYQLLREQNPQATVKDIVNFLQSRKK